MLKKFKEYLNRTISESLLLEMARYQEQPRIPVNIDNDDIVFLQQFDFDEHTQAKKQRYDMLFEALKKLHERRVKFGMKRLAENIEKAIREYIDGDKNAFVQLQQLDANLALDKDEISKLKNEIDNARRNSKKIRELDIQEEADRLSWEHVKKYVDGIPEQQDGPRIFVIKKGNKIIKRERKPYLNRLYHKLERTIGEEHNPQLKKLLGELGKYSFDLSHPVESDSEKSTRGMKFPKKAAVEKRLLDYQSLLSHEMFGDIPKSVYWMRAPGKRKDKFTFKKYFEPIYKRYFRSLTGDESVKNLRQQENKASLLAKQEMARELQKNPNAYLGPTYIIKNLSTGEPVDKYTAKVELSGIDNGVPQFKDPDLYLPTVKTYRCPKCKKLIDQKDQKNQLLNNQIITCTNCGSEISLNGQQGSLKTNISFTPYMKEAIFYKKLEQTDFELDDNGNPVLDDSGQPILKPGKELVGHDKRYVKVNNEEFRYGKNHKKGGAMDFNQNIRERKYVTRLNPKYDELLNKYTSEMELADVEFKSLEQLNVKSNKRMSPFYVKESSTGSYYKDFADGIVNAYKSNYGGIGAPRWLLADPDVFDAIHAITLESMYSDLYNHYRWGTKSGRIQAAKTTAGNFLQHAIEDTESRRKRTFGASKIKSLTGAEGENLDVSDEEGMKASAQRVDIEIKRDKGGRILATGPDGLYNSLTRLRNLAKDSQQKITTAKSETKEGSEEELQKKLKLLAKGALEAKNVEEEIVKIFVALGQNEQYAQSQINSWKEDRYTPEQMIQALEKHPLYIAQLGDKPVEKLQEPPEQPTYIPPQRTTAVAGGKGLGARMKQPQLSPQVTASIDSYYNKFLRDVEKFGINNNTIRLFQTDAEGSSVYLNRAIENDELIQGTPGAIKLLQNRIQDYLNNAQLPKAEHKIQYILNLSKNTEFLNEADYDELNHLKENISKIPYVLYGKTKEKALNEVTRAIKRRGL